MASVNKVILLGHLGRDPETRFTASGEPVCNFSMATTETWKDKEGQKKEQTEWHQVAFFGKLAEVAQNYLKKGSLVYIEGSITTRKVADKDGKDRYYTSVKGHTLTMLGGKEEQKAAPKAPAEDDVPA